MKILHTADIHLKELGDERWDTLKKLVQIGKKEEVEIFAICGDLFDKEIDAEMLKSKIREVFSNNGFKIVLIPGNHDCRAFEGGLHFGQDVKVLAEINKPFEYGNVSIWGLAFESIEGAELLRRIHVIGDNLSKDKVNILLYHGELIDSFFARRDFGEEGQKRYMPVKLSYFDDMKIDYILAGHFHSKFDVWNLKNGGYFIYPGSPISITKAELGQRKVNVFEVGEEPNEYPIDTPHFENVTIDFDPFSEEDPIELVRERIEGTHPKASIILTIKGYINSEKIGATEDEIVEQLRKISRDRCLGENFKPEFNDISRILEDDLFKDFMAKLELRGYDEKGNKKLQEIAIRAMMELKK